MNPADVRDVHAVSKAQCDQLRASLKERFTRPQSPESLRLLDEALRLLDEAESRVDELAESAEFLAVLRSGEVREYLERRAQREP